MGTALFDAPVFGPIKSRRLGVSLGINLLPADGKLCSFNCLYCECGSNEERRSINQIIPTRDLVKKRLEERLKSMSENGNPLDVITFAGNGEPTLHPEFSDIIDDVIELKNKYYPLVKISVLSNAAHLDRKNVYEGLLKVDNNILKLDSAIESTFHIINEANSTVNFKNIVPGIAQFKNGVIVQTLFCRGTYQGVDFDNTTENEVDALIEAYKLIAPSKIMIYSISRDTPVKSIFAVEKDELEKIAEIIRQNGLIVETA